MNEGTNPCPHCRGTLPQRCRVCDGRGYWPGAASLSFLEAITITGIANTTEGPVKNLTGSHGVVVGIVYRETLHNFTVIVEGQENTLYEVTPGAMKTRAPETIPRCPACDEPLKISVGQMNRHLGTVAWQCATFGCDVQEVCFEFSIHFDFSLFAKQLTKASEYFPNQSLKEVWTFALTRDCDLAQMDGGTDEQLEAIMQAPDYLEAKRILHAAYLTPAQFCMGCQECHGHIDITSLLGEQLKRPAHPI